MLTVENISFGYSPKKDLLRDLSFTLDKGDVVCLLGPNGAGENDFAALLIGY